MYRLFLQELKELLIDVSCVQYLFKSLKESAALNCSLVWDDVYYQIEHYKIERMQEIRQQIEREDLQHKHAIKKMKNLLATARAGSVIPTPSVTMNTEGNSVVVMMHQVVIATSVTGGCIALQLNVQKVKQQIEMEALQHSNKIRKMQSFLAASAKLLK